MVYLIGSIYMNIEEFKVSNHSWKIPSVLTGLLAGVFVVRFLLEGMVLLGLLIFATGLIINILIYKYHPGKFDTLQVDHGANCIILSSSRTKEINAYKFSEIKKLEVSIVGVKVRQAKLTLLLVGGRISEYYFDSSSELKFSDVHVEAIPQKLINFVNSVNKAKEVS